MDPKPSPPESDIDFITTSPQAPKTLALERSCGVNVVSVRSYSDLIFTLLDLDSPLPSTVSVNSHWRPPS